MGSNPTRPRAASAADRHKPPPGSHPLCPLVFPHSYVGESPGLDFLWRSAAGLQHDGAKVCAHDMATHTRTRTHARRNCCSSSSSSSAQRRTILIEAGSNFAAAVLGCRYNGVVLFMQPLLDQAFMHARLGMMFLLWAGLTVSQISLHIPSVNYRSPPGQDGALPGLADCGHEPTLRLAFPSYCDPSIEPILPA
jgi:hypothetical protein